MFQMKRICIELFENIAENGEIADYQHFVLYQQ